VNQKPETLETTSAPPRKSVARNSLWNFAGQISPLLIAAFAIPILIHHLGVDRFGVLTLAWILVGYFSLFDLGIGRAITKLLAEKMALGDCEGATNLIWTAIFSMLLLGMFFGGVMFAFAPWLSHSMLKIPPSLQGETLSSLPWLALAVPFVTLTCGFRGMLEAQQNFAAVNALRAGLGVVTYLGPLLVLPFTSSMVPVVLTLTVARIISCGLHFWVCMISLPAFSLHLVWDRRAFRAVLGFGSWLTVSNIVSPIMVYLDRFLIGSLISLSAVVYYAAPFDAVTKLWLIPSALSGVLFPAFSEALAVEDRDRANSLYQRGVVSTFAILFPLILATILFAHEGLRLWLGADFANRSTVILQILAIGVFTNSLANMPYALLQASGRPDLTAKIHLIEVPCYLALLYWGIHVRGIEGAAVAWTLRLSVEGAILFFFIRDALAPRLWITMAAGTTGLFIALGITGLLFRFVFLVAALSVFGCVTWRFTLDDLLRGRLRSWLKAVPALKANA
jgi:O-antigen/teichoic acid export membrane protein